MTEVAYWHMNFSEGEEGRAGGGPTGRRRTARASKGQFEYVGEPAAMGPQVEELAEVDPRLYGTPKQPVEPSSS